MEYPLKLALRYLGSKKRASISVGTLFAILGVALGVAALATIMSVTGGFHAQFRQKVLGVNAHVLVLKHTTNFREYRAIMQRVATIDGVVGVAPFSINPMMLTHGDATATGVLVKGVDPRLSLGVPGKDGDEWGDQYQNLRPVLDLPNYVVAGSLEGLRLPNAKPAKGKYDVGAPPNPFEKRKPFSPLPRKKSADANPSAPKASASSTAAPAPTHFAGGDLPAAPGAASAKPAVATRNDEGLVALPEDDNLPPEIDPDICRDPEVVKELPGLVMGVPLAKSLGLQHETLPDGTEHFPLGDCVMVTSPTIGFSLSRGQIRAPIAKRFRVIALFEAGFDQYDSKLVYTDLYEAQSFHDHGDTVTGVELKIADIDEAGAISNQIRSQLTSGMYHTMDWEELNHGLFTALKLQQWFMSAVLAIIIVVAAFTVVATLIMVVLDKQKEISVLKAMGATDGAILRVFLYQGSIIGLTGTFSGLLVALIVCKGLLIYGFPLDPKVYFISRLPVQVRPLEFIVTGVIALFICLVATIIPSVYAARLRPVDGFRRG